MKEKSLFKFRAWDITRNEMINVREIDFDTEEINNYTNYLVKRPAIPFLNIELMQSTGMKDSSGKEIYEGDIVLNIQSNSVGKVYWDVHNVGFYRSVKRKGTELFDSFTLFRSEHNLKIIGNIYENADLLEVEE